MLREWGIVAERIVPSSQEQLCIQLGILRPGLNFTIAIPLKAGWQIKGGAVAKRADMEQFAQSVASNGIGRIRAVNLEDRQAWDCPRVQGHRKLGAS